MANGFPDPLKKTARTSDPDGSPTKFFVQQWNLLLNFVKDTLADIVALIVRIARLEAVEVTTTAPISGGGNILTLSPITHDNSGATPGAYTNANVTVDATGHVTAISSGGASGGAWTLTDTHDFAATPQANYDIDVTGTDMLVVALALTNASGGFRILRVSTDGGSTFYSTSGDYIALPASGGVPTSVDSFGFHNVGSTTGRGGVAQLSALNVDGGPKVNLAVQNSTPSDIFRLFTASLAPITTVRLLNSAGGNITGGTIYVFQR